jgi:hypothetical protein
VAVLASGNFAPGTRQTGQKQGRMPQTEQHHQRYNSGFQRHGRYPPGSDHVLGVSARGGLLRRDQAARKYSTSPPRDNNNVTKLQEKKKDNKCDGSCAGIQYFSCLPGYGVFTTIDRIFIPNSPLITNKDSPRNSNLDRFLEKNVSSLSMNDSKPKYEEIVTKFGEYSQKAGLPPKNSTYLRNSLSLQNILDTECLTANSNNDFDQNSIIQPDRSQLINEKKAKMKSEMDLSDIIGASWHGATDAKELEKFSNLNRTLGKNENHERNGHRETSRANRNKSANILSHFYDSTLPKRNKVATAKFYDNTLPRKVNGVKNGSSSNQEEESKSKRIISFSLMAFVLTRRSKIRALLNPMRTFFRCLFIHVIVRGLIKVSKTMCCTIKLLKSWYNLFNYVAWQC